MNRFKDSYILYIIAGLLVLGACSNDPLVDTPEYGAIQLSMPGISTEVSETRSTPSDLGTPASTDFHLSIVRESNGVTIYDGTFTSDKIKASPDDYDISVAYGTNPILGLDAPYYIGTASATVESTTEPTEVSIPVKVGNALVSAVFNDAERFSRFYDSYAVEVRIGTTSASITNEIPNKSVYVRAGNTVELFFTGYLKALEKQVSMPIQLPDGVSNTLQAADHLILTLALEPNAESAVVNVVKAELEKVNVEEKVSYNWLPCPVVTTEHKYVRGELVGTDLSIGASFPGTTWEARIHQGSASGSVVRVLSGQGALTSTYQLNPGWPYLPPGTYVATYRYYSKQGKAFNFSKTTEFTVPDANLTLTADAYTSYSYYEQGDIDAANACERLTVYKPSAQWNVATSLLTNANYAKTFTYSIGSQSFTVDASAQKMTFSDITGVPVSGSLYTYKVVGNFAGQNVTGTKQVRITGLPYSLNLSSHSEWSEDGSVNWDSGDVRLGYYTTGDQSITTTSSVNIPQGTRYCADYSVNVHTGTVGTTFSITAGSQVILSIKEGGGTFLVGTDNPHNGTTTIFSANSNITSLTCTNSYGAGATCSYIYSLTFKYAQ
ncbi:MAG: DUF4493 domain-containing protein [Bacteroidaceae bacterium]|nr:DUF4493 domain-containing protein [Bacteroidaceae bacterium]